MVKFAVVVVIDDEGALALGPVKQREAAVDRQRDAERKLMSRRDNSERRVGRAPGPGRYLEPFVVDRDRSEPQVSPTKKLMCEEVAGIIDPDLVTRRKQRLDDEAERALEACGDHDLVGHAGNVARDPQIARDRLS